MKNSFYLVIPELKQDAQLSAAFDDAALSRWVAELPTANVSLATRLFHDLIIAFNHVALPAQKRLSALEILRPSFLIIEESLRSRLINGGFPKGANEQKIFDVVVSIEKQMTLGYWMVVRELSRKDASWFQGRNIALPIQRTIRGLSGIVLTYYMMSAAIPDWIWIDLHSLYKLGVQLGKDDAKVVDPVCVHSKNTTISECYMQMLLLSLANPAGLMQKEFLQVYTFIERIVGLVKIVKLPVAEQPIQATVLLDEDASPCFTDKPRQNDAAAQFFDLSKLYKALTQADKWSSKEEARFSSMDAKRSQNKLPVDLFDYLVQRWRGKELLGTPFFVDRLNRFIAVGLDATHELQNATSAALPNEIVAEAYSERALSCRFEKDGILSVGSLVSFRKTDMAPHLRSLGVVIKIAPPKPDGRLVFELNAVAVQSFSVSYAGLDAGAQVDPKKALLYGVKSPEGEKSFVILDSFVLKDGDQIRMTMNQDRFPVVLSNRKNIGLGYWQFECRRLVEKPDLSQDKKKGYDFI